MGSGGSLEQPAYGDERIMLLQLRGKKGNCRIERQIFVERGATHIYDETAKDWVTWQGEYVALEVLGSFDSRESALRFMNERSETANAS